MLVNLPLVKHTSRIVNKLPGTYLLMNNYELEERSTKQSIGVVPQKLVIDPYFTPKETLEFQAGYYGIKKQAE